MGSFSFLLNVFFFSYTFLFFLGIGGEMESPFDCFITGIKKSVYTFPFQYSVSFVSLWNNCEAFLRNPQAHNPYYYSDSNTAHTFPSYIYTYMPSMWIYIFPLSIVPRFQFLKSSFLYLAFTAHTLPLIRILCLDMCLERCASFLK